MNIKKIKYAIALAMPLVIGCATMPINKKDAVYKSNKVYGYTIREDLEAQLDVIAELENGGEVVRGTDGEYSIRTKDAHPEFKFDERGVLEKVLKKADTNGDNIITEQEVKALEEKAYKEFESKNIQK